MKDSWEGLRHEVRYRRQRPPLRGLRHEDADRSLSAYLGIRQSSISDAKRRVVVPAAWLLTLLTREGVNPT